MKLFIYLLGLNVMLGTILNAITSYSNICDDWRGALPVLHVGAWAQDYGAVDTDDGTWLTDSWQIACWIDNEVGGQFFRGASS